MKKVAAVFFITAMSLIILSQPAMARTSVTVGVSQPGFYFEASNARPCRETVYVEREPRWHRPHYVVVPAHRRNHHVARTVYVPVYERHRDFDRYDGHRNSYGRGEHREYRD